MTFVYPVQDGEPERMTPEVMQDTAIPTHGPSSAWPRTNQRAMTNDPSDDPAEILEDMYPDPADQLGQYDLGGES